MGIQEQIQNDMKAAMKSGDKIVLETLRMVRAQIKNTSIAKGEDLSEEDVFGILSKEYFPQVFRISSLICLFEGSFINKRF